MQADSWSDRVRNALSNLGKERFVNPVLAHHPKVGELRQMVVRIAIMSQVPAAVLGRSTPSSDEDIGGKRPGEPTAVRGFEDHQLGYRQKSADYFRRRFDRLLANERATVADLEALVLEADEALAAWSKTPLPSGDEPEYGSPQWKRYIAESSEDAGVLARRYWNPSTGKNITRQYINKVRREYRES